MVGAAVHFNFVGQLLSSAKSGTIYAAFDVGVPDDRAHYPPVIRSESICRPAQPRQLHDVHLMGHDCASNSAVRLATVTVPTARMQRAKWATFNGPRRIGRGDSCRVGKHRVHGGSAPRARRGRAARQGGMDGHPRQPGCRRPIRLGLSERVRAEWIAGAEEEWRRRTGRRMTAEELERLLRRFPGAL